MFRVPIRGADFSNPFKPPRPQLLRESGSRSLPRQPNYARTGLAQYVESPGIDVIRRFRGSKIDILFEGQVDPGPGRRRLLARMGILNFYEALFDPGAGLLGFFSLLLWLGKRQRG
jgi:hypothetical protein